MSSTCSLDLLADGQTARVVSIRSTLDSNAELFWELGITEGAQIELVRRAPFFKDPLLVRCNGVLVAVRKSEATQIEVQL